MSARLHVQDKTHLIREPLSSHAECLDPTEFQRIYRSCIAR